MANYTSTHTGAVIDAAVTKITATSSSATELNLLDGVTATTAEINILDGVTSTAAELNILDGVTSTASELNILDGVTATAAEINLLDGLTATTTELNLIDGVTATTAEINYIDGVTSNIQTQLNLKAPIAGATFTGTTTFATLSDGTIAVTAFVDEDNMASDSATLIPTQQSVKAYVDTTAQTTEEVQDIVGAMFSSNTESGITVDYQDGDGTIDLTVGTLNQDTTGTAATVTTAAQPNITSLGTLTTLTVDNVIVNGTTIGHTSDTDLITLADGNVTIAGELDLTTLDVSGNADIDGTLETDALTIGGVTSVPFEAADHSKLDGIEASADVTDTANVTSAGALMDSELASIADVKALDQSVVSGATPTFTTTNFTDASNKRLMTDAQETKLDSVESNATADQTDEEIQDVVGAMFSSNTETGITATYQDGDGTIDLVVGTLNQDTTGTASKTTVTDSTANTNFPVVFHDESNALLDDTGALRYNPSTGELLVPKLTVAGTTTQVDTVTMEAENAIIFEGATADSNETTLSIVDPTADHTQYLINQGGYIPLLAAATTTAITSTPAELNILDGVTSTAAELNILDGVTATAAELNIMDGVTATTAELNYTDGVTSNIQTQLDATLDTAGALIDLSSTTINVDLTEAGEAAIANGDYILFLDGGATGTHAKEALADVATLFAGAGMTATNSVLNVIAGTGIDVAADAISVDVSDFMANGANNYIVTATGTDAMNAEANLTFDGTNLDLPDSKYIRLGTGNDLQIFHDGTDNYIKSVTSDQDFIIQVNDGGSNITALKIDASAVGNVSLPNDNQGLHIGASSDLQLYHQSDHNYILTQKVDADLYIRHNTSGGYINAIQIDASDAGSAIFNHDVKVNDSGKLKAGDGNDFQMTHDGTNSYLINSTGHLYIQSNEDDKDLVLQCDDGSGGTTAYLTLDGSATRTNVHKDLRLDNSVNLSLGGGGNMSMSHDGSNATFSNATGNLTIQTSTDDGDVIFRCDDGSGGVTSYLTLDGSATTIEVAKKMQFPASHSADKIVMYSGGNEKIGTEANTLLFTADNYKFKDTNGDDNLFMNNSGQVGIGTTTPDSYNAAGRNLVVADSGDSGISIVAGTSSDSSIMFADGTGGTAGYRGRVAYDHNGDYLRFDTAAAERMRIDSSGNCGIGTSSPGAKLDIENSTAPTLDNDTHAGEALFLRSGGSDGDGNVQAVLAFGKADSSSRRSGSAIASVQTDSDVDKVGIGFYTSDSSSSSQTMDQRVLIDHVGNMRFSDNGANPSASTNMAFIFNDGGEMKVLDELGNTTTISPHNFELIPEGASEDMAWSHHSVKGNKTVNVDMMKLARLVEQLTGEKLVYTEET